MSSLLLHLSVKESAKIKREAAGCNIAVQEYCALCVLCADDRDRGSVLTNWIPPHLQIIWVPSAHASAYLLRRGTRYCTAPYCTATGGGDPLQILS